MSTTSEGSPRPRAVVRATDLFAHNPPGGGRNRYVRRSERDRNVDDRPDQCVLWKRITLNALPRACISLIEVAFGHVVTFC